MRETVIELTGPKLALMAVICLSASSIANSPERHGPDPKAVLSSRGIDPSEGSLKSLAIDSQMDREVRQLAIHALGNSKDARHLPTILPLLKEEEIEVRASAMMALRSIASQSSEHDVVQVLHTDRDETVRRLAVLTLESIASPTAIDELLATSSNKSESVSLRTDSILAVERMVNLERISLEDVAKDLRLLLADDDKRVRLAAALPLANGGEPAAIPILVEIATQYIVSQEAAWERSKAIRSIEKFTEQDFGFFRNGDRRTTAEERSEAVRDIADWWAEHSTEFEPSIAPHRQPE